jgi:hypothetical protein
MKLIRPNKILWMNETDTTNKILWMNEIDASVWLRINDRIIHYCIIDDFESPTVILFL